MSRKSTTASKKPVTVSKNPTRPYMLGGMVGGCIGGASIGAMIAMGGVHMAPGNWLLGGVIGAVMGVMIGFRMGVAVHTDIPRDSSESQGLLGSAFGRAFVDLLGSTVIWAGLGYALGRGADALFMTTQSWLLGALIGGIGVPLLYSLTYSSNKPG